MYMLTRELLAFIIKPTDVNTIWPIEQPNSVS